MDDMDNFDVTTFEAMIDANLATMVSMIEQVSDEKLNEEKTLFGRFTDMRAGHMLTVYNWHVAYKTQIFLQLKAAHQTHIKMQAMKKASRRRLWLALASPAWGW